MQFAHFGKKRRPLLYLLLPLPRNEQLDKKTKDEVCFTGHIHNFRLTLVKKKEFFIFYYIYYKEKIKSSYSSYSLLSKLLGKLIYSILVLSVGPPQRTVTLALPIYERELSAVQGKKKG